MDGNGVGWPIIVLVMLVFVGAVLVVFLGYLVRTAYEMKSGLKIQLDRGLRHAEDESAKRGRALRQELGGDVERAKQALSEEARRRFADTLAVLQQRQADFLGELRQERIQAAVAMDALRDEIAALNARIADLERELLVGGAALEPMVGQGTVSQTLQPQSMTASSLTG